jgi:hypothetical protein
MIRDFLVVYGEIRLECLIDTLAPFSNIIKKLKTTFKIKDQEKICLRLSESLLMISSGIYINGIDYRKLTMFEDGGY